MGRNVGGAASATTVQATTRQKATSAGTAHEERQWARGSRLMAFKLRLLQRLNEDDNITTTENSLGRSFIRRPLTPFLVSINQQHASMSLVYPVQLASMPLFRLQPPLLVLGHGGHPTHTASHTRVLQSSQNFPCRIRASSRTHTAIRLTSYESQHDAARRCPHFPGTPAMTKNPNSQEE